MRPRRGGGGALKKLTVLETGEVFTANIRDQEKPGLEYALEDGSTRRKPQITYCRSGG